jgi:hypothetical protein
LSLPPSEADALATVAARDLRERYESPAGKVESRATFLNYARVAVR